MDAARSAALEVLRRVSTQGAFAGTALRHLMPEGATPADRGLVTELVYGVLRRRGHLDRALKKASGRRLKDLEPKIHDVLRLGAYQIMFLERVPDHASVNAAVELAKHRAGKRGAGRVNQILRALADTAPEDRLAPSPPLKSDPVGHVAAEGSVGRPVAEVLVDALGPETALAFVLASLAPAPLTLRPNRLKISAEALAEEIEGSVAESGAVRTPDSLRKLPSELAAVREGRASPQDEASMKVVELLDPQPGERVLDVCAAPGGKTTYIAERMRDQGQVIAHDRLPDRLARVGANAERLGLSIIELAEVLPEPEPRFDRVLVDAPCSGLGTLRRHPEIRWRFRTEDLDGLTPTQDKVLRAGAERLVPGGVLVYSICSVTRAEGRARVEGLEGFTLEEELSTGPHQPGAPDGFYAARLRKQS